MSQATPPNNPNMHSAMATQDPLHLFDDVAEQIDALDLKPELPLIVTDCDEVLMQFLVGLETYLATKDLWLDLQSFALTGNIKHRESNEVVAAEKVQGLLKDFFATSTEKLLPVPGAAEALKSLSDRAQIVVLTNVPLSDKVARTKHLASEGMDYPVIANKGLKGGAVRRMAERVNAPVFFLDDIPHNIAAVAKAHDACHLLHFIADKRLANLMGAAADSHFHTSDWTEAHNFISSQLDTSGF